jgi:GT2 family glycosyltransferase
VTTVLGSEPLAVVIATRDRRERLLTTLGRLSDMPACPPVVVVDNGSSDGTAAAVAAEHPEVRIVRLPVNLGAAARNVGVAAAATPYVAFADDDTWWEASGMERALDQLQADPRVAIVTGRVTVEPAGREDPTCAAMAASPIAPLPGMAGRPVIGFLAGASMIRASAFREVGGFDPRWGIGAEERKMALDLWARNYAVVYADDVLVHHEPFQQRDHHGRSVMQRRNELWCAWLRYDGRRAVRETIRIARACRPSRQTASVLGSAARGLPWIIRERSVLPTGVLILMHECDRATEEGGGRD